MGISIQIYLIDENDRIKRFPLARFERLMSGDPEECVPLLAGKQVRSVEAAVYFEGRKPVQVVRTIYFMIYFDSEGRIDQHELNKQIRLSIESMPPIETGPESDRMIDAKHRFAHKHYKDRYRWTPTAKIEKAVINAIFGGDIF